MKWRNENDEHRRVKNKAIQWKNELESVKKERDKNLKERIKMIEVVKEAEQHIRHFKTALITSIVITFIAIMTALIIMYEKKGELIVHKHL